MRIRRHRCRAHVAVAARRRAGPAVQPHDILHRRAGSAGPVAVVTHERFSLGESRLAHGPPKLASALGGGWVNDCSDGFVRTLGAVEILGAVGLILPEALDIAPVLTPLAALGLAAIVVGAVVLRIRRRETTAMLVNLTYLMLALFVALGRSGLGLIG